MPTNEELMKLLGLTPEVQDGTVGTQIPTGPPAEGAPIYTPPPQEESEWYENPLVLGAGGLAALLGGRKAWRAVKGADNVIKAITDERRLLPPAPRGTPDSNTIDMVQPAGPEGGFEDSYSFFQDQIDTLKTQLALDPTNPELKRSVKALEAGIAPATREVKNLGQIGKEADAARAAREAAEARAVTDQQRRGVGRATDLRRADERAAAEGRRSAKEAERAEAKRLKEAEAAAAAAKQLEADQAIAQFKGELVPQPPTLTETLKGSGGTLTRKWGQGRQQRNIAQEIDQTPDPGVGGGGNAATAGVPFGPDARVKAMEDVVNLSEESWAAIKAHEANPNDPDLYAAALDKADQLANLKTRYSQEGLISKGSRDDAGKPLGHMLKLSSEKGQRLPTGKAYQDLVDQTGNIVRSIGVDRSDTREIAARGIHAFHQQMQRGGTPREMHEFMQTWLPENLGPNPRKAVPTVELQKTPEAIAAGQNRAAERGASAGSDPASYMEDVVAGAAERNAAQTASRTQSVTRHPLEQLMFHAKESGMNINEARDAISKVMTESPSASGDELVSKFDEMFAPKPEGGGFEAAGGLFPFSPSIGRKVADEFKGLFKATPEGTTPIGDAAVEWNRNAKLAGMGWMGNAFVGPWSSIPWTAAEEAASSLAKKGLKAVGYTGELSDASMGKAGELMKAANPVDFGRRWGQAGEQALKDIERFTRDEAPISDDAGALRRLIQTPGRGLRRGDLAGQSILEPIIGQQRSREALLIPPDPHSKSGKAFVDMVRSGGNAMKMVFPFAKTPTVSVEEALSRNPITGMMQDKFLKQEGRRSASPLDRQIARQFVTGPGAAGAGYVAGQEADARIDQMDISPAAKALMKTAAFGLSGVAGGPNSTLMRAGFGAGEFVRDERDASPLDALLRGARAVGQDAPMLTPAPFEALDDAARIKAGDEEFNPMIHTPGMPTLPRQLYRAMNPPRRSWPGGGN